jgi:ribosomal protein L37AE/L43A
MVYLPTWLVNYQSGEGSFFAIIDAVAKRVVAIREGEMSQANLLRQTDNLASSYKMVKHRCNYCGFDLPKQKTGEVFICANCGRTWQAGGESYRQITINLPRISFDREARMFPFWMFELSTSDDNDLLKRALKLESDTLFIPAFELRNLKRAARVALSYSHKIDRIDFDKLEENSYPVQAATLNKQAAERMILPLLLAGRDHIEHLDLEALFRLHLQFDNVIPVWLPFVEENYFYVGQMTGLGFEKSAVD